jgi:hypothetical protein
MKPPLLLAAPLLLLTACDTYIAATQSGEIPAANLTQASALQGTYAGKFATHNGTFKGRIVFSLDGAKPVIDPQGDFGRYLEKCNAKIGTLTSLTLRDSATGPVGFVQFNYDGGNCKKYDWIDFTFHTHKNAPTTVTGKCEDYVPYSPPADIPPFNPFPNT